MIRIITAILTITSTIFDEYIIGAFKRTKISINFEKLLLELDFLELPRLIRHLFSFPLPSPGSPINPQPLITVHFPFTFCLIFLHIVALA